MNKDKLITILLGMASLNRMLIEETRGDDYWDAITDEFSTYLIMAGTELQYPAASLDDTAVDHPAIVAEELDDTREFPVVRMYDMNGKVS